MTVRTVDRLEDLPEDTPSMDADFVVVDVILASTSIVRLLEEGARYVRPFGDEEAALRFKRENEATVLVGEQGGAPVDGFDLLPLPSKFEEHNLKGKRVGMLTTNGTRAITRVGRDEGVFVGSTVNAEAVAGALDTRDRDAWLVAAGRYGETTPEDTAGVSLIRAHYEDEAGDEIVGSLRDEIRSSATAGWIEDLGLGEEIEAILDFNSTDTVPRMRDGVFVAE